MSQNQDIFNVGLAPNPANFQALTPLSFLGWAEEVYGASTAIIHGDTQFTYAQFAARCRRLASALTGRGIGQGHRQRDTPCGWPHLDVKRTEVWWQFNEDGVDHGRCATDFVDR